MTRGAINYRKAGIFALAILLAACSGIPRQQRDQARLDQYLQYAGPPIKQFTWLGHYYGWEYLANYQVVVWITPNDAYLIKVLPPCEELPWANRIGLTSTQDTVISGLDFVLVRQWKCQIGEIRPVDYLRMKHDLRDQSAAQKAQGSTTPHRY